MIGAAGGLLWRHGPSGIEIAAIHDPEQEQWMLPRADLDDGEHPVLAAVRAVRAATGSDPQAGRRLPTRRYDTVDGVRQVEFWVMRAVGVLPFDAMDRGRSRIDWLSLAQAERRLLYAAEAGLVGVLAEVAADSLVLLVRHASAGDPDAWTGSDALRPLDDLGSVQAEGIREVLPVFEPDRIVSACCTRCIDTVRPLARRLGLPVETAAEFGELQYAARPADCYRRIRSLAERTRSCVVCSQGAVIPDLVATLAAQSGLALEHHKAAKGSVWALSFHGPQLIAADYYPSFLTAATASAGPMTAST